MPITRRELKEYSVPETLSGEEARKLLGRHTSFDVTQYPDLDILMALFLYPNSTYEELTDKGFHRFQNTWNSYLPDFMNNNLIERSPEDKYSLTGKGEVYLISRTKELQPSLFTTLKKYFTRQ